VKRLIAGGKNTTHFDRSWGPAHSSLGGLTAPPDRLDELGIEEKKKTNEQPIPNR
jgi:hypothetical protein